MLIIIVILILLLIIMVLILILCRVSRGAPLEGRAARGPPGILE